MTNIMQRGKTIDTGEWVYGYYVYTHGRHRIVYEDRGGFYCEEEVDPETVGNGCEINGKWFYEGDIINIKIHDHISKKIIAEANEVVGFKNGKLGVKWGWERFFTGLDSFSHNTAFKVVGIVHDNPEILEVEK